MARAAYRTNAYKKETLLQDDMSDPRYDATDPIVKRNNLTTSGAAEQNE